MMERNESSAGTRKIVLGMLLAAAAAGAGARPFLRWAVFPGVDTPIPAELRLEAPGGLAVAWVPARDARASAVYFHATNQAAGDVVLFARDLAARGVSVCVPEHRGYGGLAGEPTVAALLEDAEAALAACPRETGPRVLVGRSLGTGVATEMAR